MVAEILEAERGRLRFRHPLLASVAYADAGSVERRRMHAALAGVTSAVEERAWHLALATELPEGSTIVDMTRVLLASGP